NLGFYQTFMGSQILLDNSGVHLPAGATDYRSPATVDNGQQNITEEIRLQSADPNARLLWTTGAFFAENRQSYLEQIHDPMLQEIITALMPGSSIVDVFGVGYDPAFPNDMYYFTYAKGFRPGGANNPLPQAACAPDFQTFGITAAPTTFSSDSVNSFEIGAKNNIAKRVRLASSIYYIRWNNIQQTVVPPVCQISFIDNLGTAVAKGADLQADIALTDRFTVELAAGYTDARYTRDSSLSPTSTSGPVVTNGDAITSVASELGGGQPTAPVSVTAGL